ncbi:hypothetical protein ANO11243_059280 [Dothideomycetidae sp. 11243]|nr:hypothetical protein ANO11243_059280 [fungal sp. No.11243]
MATQTLIAPRRTALVVTQHAGDQWAALRRRGCWASFFAFVEPANGRNDRPPSMQYIGERREEHASIVAREIGCGVCRRTAAARYHALYIGSAVDQRHFDITRRLLCSMAAFLFARACLNKCRQRPWVFDAQVFSHSVPIPTDLLIIRHTPASSPVASRGASWFGNLKQRVGGRHPCLRYPAAIRSKTRNGIKWKSRGTDGSDDNDA